MRKRSEDFRWDMMFRDVYINCQKEVRNEKKDRSWKLENES